MCFKCTTCGTEHDLDKISFGADAPVQWNLLSDDEQSSSLLGGEQCEIESKEGRSYYLRACLDIPICGSAHVFTWGVWCSLSAKNYAEISEHWEDPERIKLGPYFGWLCSKIPGYPDTVFLKTMVHQRIVGLRPFVELEATDHPLAVDQRAGIEEERLTRIVTEILHGDGAKPSLINR